MVESDPKPVLHGYLKAARDAMLWKLEGLSEYDVRRPLVPTGTNLLGLLKHVASVALGYFGETFGRPSDIPLPWFDEGAESNADMWARADESREAILELWRGAWEHADSTIESLSVSSEGEVPWWPEERRQVTLHQILVHMIAETNRHAGHADIVRELIDSTTGLREGNENMPDEDQEWWLAYRARLESSAKKAAAG